MSFRFPIAIPDVAGLQAGLDGKLAVASNLGDVASLTTARVNLGMGVGAV